MSDSLQPHGLQHARFPCPSLSPWVYSSSCPSVMPSYHLILYCSLLLLPSIFPSIMVFSNESALCVGWPKCWSFSLSISPSNEYSELISFRIDWFDLLVFKGLSKSFLQHHNFVVSLLYGPTLTSVHDYWKNYSFDYMKLLAKWWLCFFIHCLGLSQLFFQEASIFISWLKSQSIVILEP